MRRLPNKSSRIFRQALIIVATAALISGCAAPRDSQPSGAFPAADQADQIRPNCYSLLHQLLEDEKNLDKLLIIKKESRELHKLVKAIATTSAAGAKQLESYARSDRSIHLKTTHLPPGEVATRDAIAKTKTKVLLTPFDPNFEFYLLLTQSEALSYAWHLAEVAASREPDPRRSSGLNALSQSMKSLYDQTMALLKARAPVAKS